MTRAGRASCPPALVISRHDIPRAAPQFYEDALRDFRLTAERHMSTAAEQAPIILALWDNA
jgi:hypothetical protein